MPAPARITVLVENTAHGRGTLGEHGLSWLIEWGDQRFLFDTGQGTALAHNAPRLGADLARLDGVVLSHGHYDHTGGLPQALGASPRARVFLHPAALEEKWVRRFDGTCQPVGLPDPSRAALERAERVLTEGVTEIAPGLFVTGEVPRPRGLPGSRFFLDEKATRPDPLLDDQAVFFDTDLGVVVLLGCAHAGVLETLEHIGSSLHRPIHMVVGGTHLGGASDERIRTVVDGLEDLGVARVGPAHCTGQHALLLLGAAMDGRVVECAVGSRWDFGARTRP